ncbi:hypothetical protein CRE_24778 [Caenorhabditis remanei]|uniref:Uncharacterized protein n=1 Tax=Caenorhabditis remanei TaxID=31234 RepID=E3NCU7_CAERE|nr:hypothetical protein CRE_24778 [Caenorhabditis remanei]
MNRLFGVIRNVNMLSSVSKKIPSMPSSMMLRSVRELTNQSKNVYATREVVIGAPELKKGRKIFSVVYLSSYKTVSNKRAQRYASGVST